MIESKQAPSAIVIRQSIIGPVVIRACGIGFPPPRLRGPQARLMARRAAEVVALGNLATKLGQGPRATIRSFRYVSTSYRSNGSVEVVVEHRQ